MRVLFLLFIIVPLVEIYVLIQVGKVLGGLPTVALVVATALLGAVLLKKQGQDTLRKAQAKMSMGTVPTGEMADGLFLALGGILLLVPGFVTDAVGVACLVPKVRHLLLSWLIKRLGPAAQVQVVARTSSSSAKVVRRDPASGRTIEGEYEKED